MMFSKPRAARNVRRCLAFVLGLAAANAAADSRYQAIPIHPGYEFGTEKALILDTKAGHLWIWVESPASGDHDGGRYVIYQGQLVPGRDIGDVIAEQRWQAEKR